jgi:type VI secretion system secreted protein Hcp
MAASDAMLKLDGIDGEVKEANFVGWINVDSFSFQVKAPLARYGGAGAQASGEADLSTMTLGSSVSRAGPLIAQAGATHKVIPKAELWLRKAGGAQGVYAKYTMTNVMVSSYLIGMMQGHVTPVEQFILSYDSLDIEFQEQDAKGNMGKPVKVKFDFKAKN